MSLSDVRAGRRAVAQIVLDAPMRIASRIQLAASPTNGARVDRGMRTLARLKAAAEDPA
jgi:hypothetical protein